MELQIPGTLYRPLWMEENISNVSNQSIFSFFNLVAILHIFLAICNEFLTLVDAILNGSGLKNVNVVYILLQC